MSEQPNSDQGKRQQMRSVAIALGLGFMVLLFYAATLVRIGGAMNDRTPVTAQEQAKPS
jgi:hypothetical protein